MVRGHYCMEQKLIPFIKEVVEMKFLKKKVRKKGYVIHEAATKYSICRILNEYDNKEQAKHDLVELLTHKISEEDLLNEFDKKKSW